MDNDQAMHKERKRLSQKLKRFQKVEHRRLNKLSSMRNRCSDKVALINQLYLQERELVRHYQIDLATANFEGIDHTLILDYNGSFYFQMQWSSGHTVREGSPEFWKLLTKIAKQDIVAGMVRAKLRYVST